MPWSLAYLETLLPAFMLVLCRVSGLMIAAPLFSSPLLPFQFKALMSVGMSLAVFPMLIAHVAAPVTLTSAVTGLMGELAIGMMIGLGITLLFVGIQVAGQLISQQAGLALGDVFNPMLDSQVTVVSEVYFYVAMMVFLSVGGDHAIMRALLDSFKTVPLLSFQDTPAYTNLIIDLISLSFTIAIRMGGPTILALLLAFLTLGFISRTVPQLNILSIGFPIKIAIAIAIMAMTMMSLEPVLLDGLDVCMDGIRAALKLDGA
jgi:flagellar biosynthesis protein FliR